MATMNLKNVTLLHGDISRAEDVIPLPDGYFDLALSQRGPNLLRHRRVFVFRRARVNYYPVETLPSS